MRISLLAFGFSNSAIVTISVQRLNIRHFTKQGHRVTLTQEEEIKQSSSAVGKSTSTGEAYKSGISLSFSPLEV